MALRDQLDVYEKAAADVAKAVDARDKAKAAYENAEITLGDKVRAAEKLRTDLQNALQGLLGDTRVRQ